LNSDMMPWSRRFWKTPPFQVPFEPQTFRFSGQPR
jgi:hypothetical protein